MMSQITNKLILPRNEGLTALRDSYVLEFLDLPGDHKEKDLRKAIVGNLKNFILEFGKDFAFVDEEYRVQVGNRDFFIDLLLFNRELRCLVAIELKIGEFEPEHLGKMEFYLEALDRDVKKADENPSVGLILCTKKDEAVVEYAMSRSLSPALIAEYKLHLPDKKILEDKLRELAELAEQAGEMEIDVASSYPGEMLQTGPPALAERLSSDRMTSSSHGVCVLSKLAGSTTRTWLPDQ